MKKRALVFIPTGVLALTLLVGSGTYALFTSSTINTGNTFNGATVHITANRDHSDPIPGPMFYPDSLDPLADHPYDKSDIAPSGEAIGGWAPGDTIQREMYLAEDAGNIPAKLKGIRAKVRSSYTQTTTDAYGKTATNMVDNGVTAETDLDAYNEFISEMNVEVRNGSVLLYNGPLSGLLVGKDSWVTPKNILLINPGQDKALNLSFIATLSKDADNKIQGKNFIYDFEFYAEQAKNN